MSKSRGLPLPKYTNSDIAVIAVYRLGGVLRHVHLEDVAMKAAELSPKKFCWKKYPEQINLESVRITLKNELRATNKRVTGSIRDGYMLTPEGFSWYLADAGSGDDHALIDELHREIDRVKKTVAFSKTLGGKGNEVSIADVEALLRVDQYFTARKRRERAAALVNAAMLNSELRFVLANLKERGFNELEVEK